MMTLNKKNRIGRAHEPPYTLWALLILSLASLFRFWFVTTFELAGDEAYYWLWSKHLDLSYYSKGPGIAWVIALGTKMFGDTEFGIRFWSVVFGAGTGLGVFLLGAQIFSFRVGFWALVVACLTPLFLVGSLVMTIDPISVFLWTMAALAFWHAKDRDHVAGWALVGLLTGLGMLAKYTNVALIPSIALFCLWSPSHRRRFRHPTFWTLCVVAIACLAPVLVWNHQHGWITLTHLRERGQLDGALRFSPKEWFQFLGDQAAVFYPPFFIGLAVAVVNGRLRRSRPQEYRFLTSLFLPLFAFYGLLALNDAGQANWTAPCYVTGLVLLVAFWLPRCDRSTLARRVAGVSLGVAVVLSLGFLVAIHVRLPLKSDPLRQVRGARSLATQVQALCQESGAEFIVAGHYQTASLLTFYMTDAPEVYTKHSPTIENQFAFWPTYGQGHIGKDALYISKIAGIPEAVQRKFMSIEPHREITTQFHGHPVRLYYAYVCHNYLDTPEPIPAP